MPRPRGLAKTGGREKGTSNKVMYELRDAAQKYTPAALQVLQSIMCNAKNPAAARVAAAAELLNRGHGKPFQAMSIDLAGQMVHGHFIAPAKASHDDWAKFCEFKERQIPLEQGQRKAKLIELEAKPINGKSAPLKS